MRLFHSATSPYVRKVMVTAIETGQAEAITLVPSNGTPLTPDEAVAAHNPLGKVPALETPDGQILFDSRVICRWLDARAGTGLYGSGEAQWDLMTLEAAADGMMDAALLMVYEDRLRPEPIRSPDWVEGQWKKIARTLDVIEDRWMARIEAPDLNIGQIATACALAYLDLRHGPRDWPAGRDRLAGWFGAFAARPSMTGTAPA